MIDLSPFRAKTIAASLLLTTALFSAAGAETSLPDISPEQIRQDSEQTYNSATGITETIAPSFDPFELDETMAGVASLRSAKSATSIEGKPLSGGAFLDVSVFYTTNSNDPYDGRGLDRGVFVSGDPIDTIRYDSQILDCSQDTHTREVIYDDSYYSGARYGYISGVYRLFPRYRGHRHFGYHRGRGIGRIAGHRGYRGHRGRGHGDRAYGDRGRDHAGRRGHRDRDYRDRDYSDRDRGDRGRERGDRDRGRDRGPRGDGRNRDRTVTATNGQLVTIPNTTNNGGGRNGRNRAEIGAKERILRRMRHGEGVEYKKPVTTSAPTRVETPRTERQDRVRPTRNRSEQRRARTVNGAPAIGRPAPRIRPIQPVSPSPRPVVSSPPPVKTPARGYIKSRASTPKPPKNVQPRRTAPKNPAPKKTISRSTDRAFSGGRSQNRGKRKVLNFYPMQIRGYQRTDVSVSYRCAREDTVTLHIPQERIDAARFDGFTVLLIDREGQEVPLYVPPNYVEGFRLATGTASYSEPVSPSGYPVIDTAPYQNPNTRSSHDPIIYGDPTGL